MCVSVETMRCKNSAVVKVLHLTLHRKWFDAIASGQKREEYIDRTADRQKRIKGHKHTEMHFRNGYRKDAPFIRVEYNGWRKAVFESRPVYAFVLGKVLEIRNYPFAAQPTLQRPGEFNRTGDGVSLSPLYGWPC